LSRLAIVVAGWKWGAKWALAAVPLVGVAELALHVKQTTSDVVPASDWDAARDAVKADMKPDDLVVFAPFWADPIGREHFGDALAGRAREARPDDTRYARAFEVSIRGAHADELAGWKKVSEREVGKITIALYENPAPGGAARPKTDLVDLVQRHQVRVSRVDRGAETACAFQHGVGQPGGLGVPQGPAVPAEKYLCAGGGYVGVAVLHALDHHPHLCIFATPPGGTAALRVTFPGVAFGTALHGHMGMQWLDERSFEAAPSPTDRTLVAFSAEGHELGTAIHRAGAGWNLFELPTAELAGKKGDLVAEVSGSTRRFCFEADTR
jgi:hypothetical protein